MTFKRSESADGQLDACRLLKPNRHVAELSSVLQRAVGDFEADRDQDRKGERTDGVCGNAGSFDAGAPPTTPRS